jgi:PhnB protein
LSNKQQQGENMRSIDSYLFFDGNCRQAMEFYAKCLGGELHLMKYSDAPNCPQGSEDKVMHAAISKGTSNLMASDWAAPAPIQLGNNFSLCVNCDSREEIESLFNSIGEGGQITMPLADAFWGSHFGMLTDKFGVTWMFNFELPKQS